MTKPRFVDSSHRPFPRVLRRLAWFLVPCLTLPALADSEKDAREPVPDYSVCKTCDVHSGDDPEVRHFAGMIAETRWSMEQRETGVMIIRNDSGEEGHWRWSAEDGVLARLEPVDED